MKTILVCAAWLGAVSISALAEGEKPPGKDRVPEVERPGHEQRRHKGPKHEGPPFHHDPNEMFKRMDKNGDGLISKEEFFAFPRLAKLPEEKREKLFVRLDSDGDGNITKDEIQALRKKDEENRKREFRELDLNNSGGLDFEEFSKGKFFKRLPDEKRREIFDNLDSNKDGEISPEDRPRRPKRHPKP